MLQIIEKYINTIENEQQKSLIWYIFQVLDTTKQLKLKLAYKVPFYYHNSWICYLNTLKKGGIELAFVRANELSSETQSKLDFRNRKQVAGITFEKEDDKKLEQALNILQEAIELDKTKKYLSKRTKKSH
jgi:hypothetical protein